MKKKAFITILSFVFLVLSSCASSSKPKKGCGGETCPIGNQALEEISYVIPTGEAASRA